MFDDGGNETEAAEEPERGWENSATVSSSNILEILAN